jgi:uncharacterized membrane protein
VAKSEIAMDRLFTLGRYLFGIVIACFGFQHYMHVSSHPGLAPGPPWILSSAFAASVVGGVLLVLGIGIVAVKEVRFPAAALGTFLLMYVVFLYLPGMTTHLTSPGPWTASNELLAMCGAAFALAGTRGDEPRPRPWTGMSDRLANAGRYLFAFPLAVFGVQHFLYSRFVATLVPAWIPWRWFWAVFVGVAFIAASIGIAAKVQARVAAALMGVMFFLFVVLVHLPRVVANPHNNDEITSALVAAAMFGASFVAARSLRAPVVAAAWASSTISPAWVGAVGNPPQPKRSSHSMK